ncbi:class I adenylate-forming enzyme family protein [Bacillus sp. MUM 13]|uniref:class I adenylate-forming enzyme family protein n=1 Tax=Bacillus sp. MUM 13 TaxID=1678001 RepID=UPI0008F5C65B|nr:class I adenylate-forming enzyme family protein [Bacillus sp. MUM 13]OIK06812.1 hypothetical protein BIV59_21320 [Bacillus sp. MUM 13]
MDKPTFGDLLIRTASTHPKKIAIVENSHSITYAKLLDNVKVFQSKLSNKIKAKQTVALFLPNSIDYVTSYFAASMLGATVFPIYWNSNGKEVSNLLKSLDVSVCITNEEGKNKLNSYKKICVINYTEEEDPDALHLHNIYNDESTLFLQTSGTTSSPKVVAHTYESIIKNIKAHVNSLDLKPKDVVLITLPMPFGYCNTSQLLAHIYLGSTIVLANNLRHPKTILRYIQAYKVTTVTVVPTILKTLSNLNINIFNKYSLKSLRYICFGGGSVSSRTIEIIRTRFIDAQVVQTYGQTEAGPRITTKIINGEYSITNVGKPLEGVKVEIRNQQGVPLLENEVGEIYVSSVSLMRGYVNNVSRLHNLTQQPTFLQTGDIGYLDQGGELHLLGRTNNIIKHKGIQVSPEEIEEVIKETACVDKVIVKGEEDELYGQIPVAYIMLEDGFEYQDALEEIRSHCHLNLSNHKIPRKLVIVDDLARTANGKLRR